MTLGTDLLYFTTLAIAGIGALLLRSAGMKGRPTLGFAGLGVGAVAVVLMIIVLCLLTEKTMTLGILLCAMCATILILGLLDWLRNFRSD
jgi:hypothetical protein